MNTLVRRLLSGASLATLQLCAVTAARATAINITAAQVTGPVTVPPGQSADYILVSGTVNGDVTNEGTIGPASTGISITGTVTGSVVNAKSGVIAASHLGVNAGAGLAGGIDNEGEILVSNSVGGGFTAGVNYSAHGVAELTNNGTVSVAVSKAFSGIANSQAFKAIGLLLQDSGNGGTAAATLANAGTVSLDANVSDSAFQATNSGRHLYAVASKAFSILENNFTEADASLTNSGSVSLNARAIGTAALSVVRMSAVAQNAMDEAVFGSGSVSANLSMDNTGSIDLVATAEADGNGDSFAQADALATKVFFQNSNSTQQIAEIIANAGPISVMASAVATAASNVSAKAHVAVASQILGAATGVQAFDNSGTITVKAYAKATATAGAHAEAGAHDAFRQDSYTGNAAQTFTNSGTIAIGVSAVASGANAQALALVSDVLDQSAFNSAQDITQAITNSGSFTVSATRKANGPGVNQAARAGVIIQQLAQNASTITQSFDNAGNIIIAGVSVLTATQLNASFNDGFVTVLQQNISRAHEAVQSFENSGTILISESWAAKSADVSTITARIGPVTLQEAFPNATQSADQAWLNKGKLGIALSASAQGFSAFAGENFSFGAGLMDQDAPGGAVTQSLTNSGSIAFTVAENARATGGNARAFAAAVDILRQETHGVSANQSLANTGSIILSFTENVQAAEGTASVSAGTLKVVHQIASGGSLAAANQQFFNTGDISVTANLSARGALAASASFLVTAAAQTVQMSAPISMLSPASASMSNSGTITLNADVEADGPTGGVRAGWSGFLQHMNLQGVTTSSAILSETNSGNIAMTLTAAAATGANVGAFVFSQSAQHAGDVAETVDNTGSVTVNVNTTVKNDDSGLPFGTFADTGASLVRQTVKAADRAALAFNNSGGMAAHVAEAVAVLSHLDSFIRATGIRQSAPFVFSSLGPLSASMSVTNSGTIAVSENLTVDVTGAGSSADSEATVLAVEQVASKNATLTESFSNSGKIDAVAVVSQNLKSPPTSANQVDVVALATGLLVNAAGSSGVFHLVSGTSIVSKPSPLSAAVSNSGTIDVAAVASGLSASATANGIIVARASVTAFTNTQVTASGVTAEDQIRRNHSEPLSGSIDNSGDLTVSATAAGGKANAVAILVKSSDPDMPVTNSGLIAASADGATATANGLELASHSNLQEVKSRRVSGTFTSGNQIYTNVFVPADAIASTISNSGDLVVNANGTVRGEAEGISLNTLDMAAEVVSSGNISVAAAGPIASAVGLKAYAMRSGTSRSLPDHRTTGGSFTSAPRHAVLATPIAGSKLTGTVDNSGTIAVSATGSGASKAIGVEIDMDSVTGKILNEGLIQAYASGETATANAILADGASFGGTVSSSGTLTAIAHGTKATAIGLDIESTGTADAAITANNVNATASGGAAKAVGIEISGGTVAGDVSVNGAISAVATGSVSAQAQAVAIDPTTISGAFVNTGALSAIASGPGAQAQAIVVVGGGGNYSVDNDGGSITATQNGGHGTAIDLSAAPSSVSIGLNGGAIHGNIVESPSGNAITVDNGDTLFDGAINPSGALIGSLNIAAGGTLTLAPGAAVNIGAYSQSGGIAFTAEPDPSTVGTLHAAQATLSGPVTLALDLGGAPYGFSTTYKLLFATGGITGTWDPVSLDRAHTFFSAAGQYSANEADIVLTRTAFDALPGLTRNEASVGSVLEKVYESSGGAGPLGSLLGAVFNLSPSQYSDALVSLSGVAAGEMSAANQSSAQSFLDLVTGHLGDPSTGDDTVASLLTGGDALAANVAPAGVSPAQVSDVSGTKMWGGGFQSGNSVSATASGPGYSSHQSGLLAGIDVAPTRNILFGVAASYGTGDIKTDKLLGFGTFSAGQVAGYGRFTADNGLYALADVSYGSFTNKLNRYVSIPGFGSGNLHGTFDSKTWGLYGEAGWHFALDGGSVTPYAAISYLDADSDGYKETGAFPLPLTVTGSSSKATSSYLGLKLATDWQLGNAAVTPRITAAWQHDFTKNAWEMGAAFTAVPTAGFGLTGSDLARDSAYVDGGITLHIANQVDVLLDYQGRFNADRTDNAFLARANVTF